MNKNIKLLSVDTNHWSKTQSIEFTLNGLNYVATRKWNSHGETTECIYSRSLPNEYYDTIATMRGETQGMNNLEITCSFGSFPDDLFEEIIRA